VEAVPNGDPSEWANPFPNRAPPAPKAPAPKSSPAAVAAAPEVDPLVVGVVVVALIVLLS
jgi:hypothetical protein